MIIRFLLALLGVLLGVLFVVSPASAACSGSSPSRTAATWADVQACYDAATSGDTITYTGGNASTSSTTTIGTTYVKIVCSPVATITDNTADASNLLVITESTAGSTSLSNCAFAQGTASHTNPQGVIKVGATAGGKPVLLKGPGIGGGDPVGWTGSSSGDFIIWNSNRGVIWDWKAVGGAAGSNCLGQAGFVRHKLTGSGESWTSAPTYGMADTNGDLNLYIEKNHIFNVFQGIDTDDNGRTVLRYNTIINSGVLAHGDTSIPGGRYMDINNNTFSSDTSTIAGCTCSGTVEPTPANVTSMIFLRAGSALIHNNTIADITSTACWGNKTSIHFTVEGLRRNVPDYGCWTGVYPYPYQPGWGHNGTGGTTTSASHPPTVNMDIEPIYLWNNTGTANYDSPSIDDYASAECGGSPQSSADYIISGRDFFVATARPGYTPYTYPHPLAGGAPADIPSYLIHQNANGKDEWAISGIQAPNGDVIAAWQEATDELNNDNRIITSRSTDGGRTWSATSELVASAGVAKYEPKFMRVGSTLWNFYLSADANVSSSTGTIFAKTSTDNGVTWSAPTSIFASGGTGVAKLCTNTNGFVKQFAPNAGRWILPVYGWSNGHNFGSVLYSDNSGVNWTQGGNTADDANIWNETSVVERANGDLWMTVRKSASPGGGFIYQSLSTDGGATWSAVTATSYVSPRAQSKPLRLASGKILLVWNNVSSTTNLPRLPLTVGISSDGGATLDATATIRSVSGNWNNMGVTQLSNGNIIVFYTDETPGDEYKRVYAAIFTEALVAPTSFGGPSTPTAPGGVKVSGGGKF